MRLTTHIGSPHYVWPIGSSPDLHRGCNRHRSFCPSLQLILHFPIIFWPAGSQTPLITTTTSRLHPPLDATCQLSAMGMPASLVPANLRPRPGFPLLSTSIDLVVRVPDQSCSTNHAHLVVSAPEPTSVTHLTYPAHQLIQPSVSLDLGWVDSVWLGRLVQVDSAAFFTCFLPFLDRF